MGLFIQCLNSLVNQYPPTLYITLPEAKSLDFNGKIELFPDISNITESPTFIN